MAGIIPLGVKSKNIKTQPKCKFAQLYACHELFLKYIPGVKGYLDIIDL